ncbi:hypothetical protein EBZ38_13485 [bacterium]|nr:hypothetical protein [bacterium]
MDPNNPGNVKYNEIGREYIATGICCMASVIVVFVIMNLYFTMKSKTYAALEGTADTISTVKSVLRKR